MNGKLTLAFSVATFITAIGVLLALNQVFDRLRAVEWAADQPEPRREPVVSPATEPVPGDAAARHRAIIEKLQTIEDDLYDSYNEIARDTIELKREVGSVKTILRRIIRGLHGAGGIPGLVATLPKQGAELDEAARKKLKDEAAIHGVKVDAGVVNVRGFLNMSPNTTMPIEFFMTRFPESSHETLVHLIGNHSLEEVNENPYSVLKGLATALYKGLLAAGFQEGEPGHPDPDSDPRDPTWTLATGDTVYVYVRYELGGETHVERATDWILDPSTGTVLPHDSFKFTGSLRHEDVDTGDELLLAEIQGLLVTVWPRPSALVEVALKSAVRNNYLYNFARIPKPEEPLFFEVLFSREPLEVEGNGAKPIEPPVRPPADDDGEDDK